MAMPGPEKVIACPHCSDLLSYLSWLTMNTLGATIWTDGKLEGPMFIDMERITRCAHCGQFFWMEDAREIGEYEYGDKDIPEEWKECPAVKTPDLSDFADAIDQEIYGSSRADEEYLRIQLWWKINDLIRNEEEIRMKQFEQQKELFRANLVSLDRLMEDTDSSGQIMRAEIVRELGEFDTCRIRLTALEQAGLDRENHQLCTQLFQLAEEKNRFVQQIP